MRFRKQEDADDLRRLGYITEPFGEVDVIVRSYPALLDGADHEDVLRDILSRLEKRGSRGPASDVFDDVLRHMACHGAVKAGMRLRPDEISELLDQEEAVPGSFACAHGRPTHLHLSLADLEKQFGRR
ncbi:MAG: hypothetical protein IIA02_11610 [Proteobacteria bacterium]|nr:hypothetical protein [Pseudomonadota bacterium]